jgi:hypothetical protein
VEQKPRRSGDVKRAPREKRCDLPRLTAFTVDQLADIIAHDGDREQLELLIYMALMHANRKAFPHCGTPGRKLCQTTQERSEQEFPEYQDAVQAPAKTRQKQETTFGAPVSRTAMRCRPYCHGTFPNKKLDATPTASDDCVPQEPFVLHCWRRLL